MRSEFVWDHSVPSSPGRLSRMMKLRESYIKRWHSNDDHAVQTLFLYEHVSEFFDIFEKRYMSKILDDISFILSQKWAFAIWEQDFYHGHICGKIKTPIKDLETLISPSNICFLYHTFEHQTWVPEAVNRNILSIPGSKPTVLDQQSYLPGQRGRGVSSSDLNLAEYARFFFKESTQSPYKLAEGTKLEIWGVFP